MYGPQPSHDHVAPNEHLPNQVAHILNHGAPVLAVRFNAQGTYCLSCGKDRVLQLWNPHRGVRIKSYTGHGYEVRDAAVSQDNNKFASCGGDRQVFLWDVTSGTILRKFRGHDAAPINAVVYSPNCEILVSGGYDQAIKVWDCRSRSIDAIQVMKAFKDSVTSVAVTGGGDILGCSVDGTIRRFDVRMGRVVTDLLHHPITSIAVSTDGGCLLAACTDSCVRLLDRADGDLLGEYRGHKHEGTKLDAAFTPSEGYVVGGSEDGRVVYWDVVEGVVVEEVQAHDRGDVVCSLAMHPRGDCLLTASVDGTVKVWK